ncbi:hypothetical protein HPC49_19305 [Pyxidicoccus fallax]|uniref:Lipoprotein n=1 Tax=Pyxidicoccus fallax TaxID=394095 RepID=A0A848L6E7_9BACT|nr:hypothetical protein [Pyxidicoccus fallax]NMO14176.1 hypothetical protein [Pyxidicoccus fallax]NPC80360.1 hypothetical protein [Pyxidicoccus fallax]
MRRASRWLGLGCVVGLMSGCAAVSKQAAPSQAEQKPTCPDTIPDELNLELGFRPQLVARTWVPALTFEHLGFQPKEKVQPAFQQEVTLASGPLQVFGLMEHSATGPEGGGSLVVARPHAGGFCVVNSWNTWQSSHVGLSLASTWTSPEGKRAIFLVKMDMPESPDGPQTRWVTLGTDGARMWIALGAPPEHQLIVPSVTLTPKGKDLYLDIKQRYVTRLRLGEDGRFILPATY